MTTTGKANIMKASSLARAEKPSHATVTLILLSDSQPTGLITICKSEEQPTLNVAVTMYQAHFQVLLIYSLIAFSVNPYTSHKCKYHYYSHFTEEETEVQSG